VQIAKLVRPNAMNSGGLLLPSKRPGFYVRAPRLATDVKIDISGPIARTIVTQRFKNPSESWVEGIYVFPLPENSAVDALKMQIGKRFIEGIIKPREEARKIYEKAKREGKKAALLEQQRPNIFTNAVANIGPGETIVVQIEYQQTIKQSSGLFSLRFPMVVAPRYSPQPIIQSVDFNKDDKNSSGWGTVNPVPDREKITPPVLDPATNALINPVTMNIRLAAGFPLGEVKSAYHQVKIVENDDSTRTLTLSNETVPADRDFELSWKAKGTAPNAALFSETIDGKDYILAFVTPPAIKAENLPKKDRETIFVIDNSGSMAGESMVQAKQALANALSRLTPKDMFNIVRFDDTFELVFPSAVPADRENVGFALNFVKRLEAEGGTEMLPALQAALIDRNSGDTSRIRQVIFITDGAIGNEKQLFDAIASGRGRSRVFTIGIGSAPNSFFMNRAAEMGRGTFTQIGALSEVTQRMSAFFEKLENPVLTGLRAEVEGGNLSDVSPNPLPDLYAGEPVVLAGAMQRSTGTLTITGDYAGQPWQVSMDLSKATKGKGIGKLWARRKIASLEVSRSYGADFAKVDKAIESTALEHSLVSRLTSLVAVDVTRSRPDSENLTSKEMPTNLPKGWVFDKVFGEDAPNAPLMQKTRAFRLNASNQVAQLIAPAPSPQMASQVAKASRSVTLPQTSTPADRNIILGIMLLLLASLLAIVSAMWKRVGGISRIQGRTLSMRDFNRLP
ncbi:MAG: marine proteobacterial sortase target protein, partial [Rhizobiaceae bacterium]|nr:marine proteobacterial sortase target protein [Rhizobiaceae bacterium]